MEGNKKVVPKVSPFKNALGGIRSMQNLSNDSSKPFLNVSNPKNFEKYEVIIENSILENELKLIQWRSKTELPIVKILFYKILQKKLLNQCTVLQVTLESFPCNLNSLPLMPLSQILYLIKQSLIGFERLFDRFGSFDITNKMVLINKSSKCKVWINENITLNFPSRKAKLNQQQFLGNIVNIFDQKCLKSTLAAEFFENIRTNNKIVEAIQYVQMFIKTHKIVMSTKLNSITESLGSKKLLEKHEQNMQKIQETILGSDSIKKIPKFITQLRQQRKHEKQEEMDSKSFDSPKKNKAQVTNRDFSLHKVCRSKLKSKIEIDSKSNLTPKSQKSIDLVKKSKMNFDKKEDPRENLILKKKKSEDCFNKIIHYPSAKPFTSATEKLIIDYVQRQDSNNEEELYYTTLQSKNSKFRKFSTNFINNSALGSNQNNGHILNVSEKAELNVHWSQQRAVSTQENIFKGILIEKNEEDSFPQTPQTPQTPSTEFSSKEQECNIFMKNKWILRMNSLVDHNFRQTMESRHDGADTFSDELTLPGVSLSYLGTMGKQLKGSITQHQ